MGGVRRKPDKHIVNKKATKFEKRKKRKREDDSKRKQQQEIRSYLDR